MTSLILLAATLSAGAPYTLEDARARASERAASVEQARLEVTAAEGDALAATGGLLPSISGFASVSTGAGLTSFGFERPVSTQIGVGVTGSWRLVSPGAWAASSAARRTAEGQEAVLAWTRAMARRDVTGAYARALAAEGVAQALEEVRADAERGMEAVSALVAAGIRPPADRERARADLMSITARAAEAKAQVVGSCAALEALLAERVTGACSLSPVAWGDPAPAAEQAHPALVASREALGAAQAGARAAWAAHLPDAGVQGTAAEYLIPDVGRGFGWSATFDVQVPFTFFTGGAGDVKAARADAARAQSQLDDQIRSLDLALLSAEASFEASVLSLAARQSALEAAQAAWDQVDSRYRAGLLGVTEWLDARRALVEARISLVQAQAAQGVALAEVEAARGVG